MNPISPDSRSLQREHAALLAAYGQAQAHCSQLLAAQAARILYLESEAMRLRAAVILRDTALAWAREDRKALEADGIAFASFREEIRNEMTMVRLRERDTEALHLRAFQAIFSERGWTLDRATYFDRYLGYDDHDLVVAFADDRGVRVTADEVRLLVDDKARWYERRLSEGSVIFPTAAAAILRLGWLAMVQGLPERGGSGAAHGSGQCDSRVSSVTKRRQRQKSRCRRSGHQSRQ